MTDQALLPQPRRSRWNGRGLTARQEQVFHWLAALLVIVVGSGWIWSIYVVSTRGEELRAGGPVAPISRSITSALTEPSASSMTFLNEALLRYGSPLRGESGKLRAVIGLPGQTVAEASEEGLAFRVGENGQPAEALTLPPQPGVHPIALEFDRLTRGLGDLSVITLVPFTEKKKGRIGTYLLGTWPYESGGKPRSKEYGNPSGFVQVTQENQDLYVSEHFRLRDFLTKGQGDVWPKYVLLDPKLLDKLELVIVELEKMGVEVEHVTVMSGFRTPHYNEGGGNTAGRANLSRHMYGDGADVFVDNDRDGWTDDVDGSGKVDTKDAEMMARAAERVELAHPSLVGGIGTYSACCGHGPFLHVDVRGHRARWRGSGNG